MDEDMAPGTAYRWSRLGDEHVSAWAELVNHLAVVDGTEEFLSAEDLAEELRTPGHDPSQDSWAVWAGDAMVGYGLAFAPPSTDHEGQARGYLGGGVHADHRGRGLGTELLDRLEPRATQLVAQRHPGVPGYLSAGGGRQDSSAQQLLTERGYAVARWFNLLTRPVTDAPVVGPVEGVELRAPREEDEEAVRLAHNAAFRDHWGSGQQSPEHWHEHWASRSSRPGLSTLACGLDGELAGQVLAYVMVGQWVDREAYVTILGTIPEARGRGIAAAALARTIEEAGRSGDVDVIELDVDSASLTGATRLYERLGFAHKHATSAMRRPLPPSS
ncbi:GNAT family N-acetyltransferase [uncultured Serinicoccus sp.]|uniref:GNAT family N-acetyltransferase n=1 Tax=uncultured Serinicoccus sp. TaxID=735514 RepID=UPI0026385502|nr:GNAT family N-acetyltransferase [uncultured Serinicoccus sp.]